MQGLVTRNTGSRYDVRTYEGKTFTCTLSNAYRLREIRTTNPVAIGDIVTLSFLNDATAIITAIAPRRNYIIRRSTNLSKEAHILAANIDRALLLANLNHPPTTTIFIDRFLATATAYNIPVILAFNKSDRYTASERTESLRLIELYGSIGYPSHLISTYSGEGMDDLRTDLTEGLTLLSGHSGVGKTSLINYLVPHAKLPVGEFSEHHHRGTHTTTISLVVPYFQGTYLIDSPGIKGFATIDIGSQEVTHYFPDLFRIAQECRFDNCTHRHEPGCAVLEALHDGRIYPSRYKSYLNIFEDVLHPNRYRPPH
ncbi:MAG: ribosome small subunit-dependent GTPase A [Tannerellaceae bacterium]|nr:ribosome small subunit-dependent GTPase A [Tannerellaceae bacterium]